MSHLEFGHKIIAMARTIPLERFGDMPIMAPQILEEPNNRPNTEFVRLNLNENPLPPSPNAIAAMHDAVNIANRYPDHSCSALAQIISERVGINTDRLVFGNGSGEVLFAAAAIAVDRNEQAVLPGPTFAPVGKNVRLAGGEVITVPVLCNGSNDVAAMLDAINEHTAMFYLCTPNSPTGGMLEADQIKLAVDRVPSDCLLIVDEAYHEFAAWEGGPDVLSLLAARDGPWAVIRTFSKAYGLSGARIGYAITCDRALAVGFSKMRIGFNVNRIGLAGACAAMRDQPYLEMVLDTISRERQRLSIALQNLGLRVYPSAANFLLARTDEPSETVSIKLAERRVLVQALPWPDDNGSLRITIGSAADNNSFLSVLSQTV